jgi:hypothetical protein
MSLKPIKGLPFVSVCTPTYNRRPFIPTMFECFKNQTYPKQNIEWIIVDDGTDTIEDLIQSSNISQIRYFTVPQKLTLGKKRNFTHSCCKGDIIIYMDDDDYYPPERISHAVETLMKNPLALCAGSSEIYTFFKEKDSRGRMIQFGPYGPNHATAGTFAFRKELLTKTQYNEEQTIGEEREFLKNYTFPFVQLDPLKTILVFSHEHNTFDKRKMLESPNPQFVAESTKTVDDFIRRPTESAIKRFFTKEMEGLLTHYEPGQPAMKPDVMKQIKEIEEERKKKQAPASIVFEKPGEPPRVLTVPEIIEIIQQQQQTIQQQQDTIVKQQSLIQQLQNQCIVFSGPTGEPLSLNHAQILEQMKRHQLESSKKDTIIQNLQTQLLFAKQGRCLQKSDPEKVVSVVN